MKKIGIIMIVVAIVAVMLGLRAASHSMLAEEESSVVPFLTLNENKIPLIVADTEETRVRGLGGKNSLPEDSAMLFVFNEPDYHGIWMKDMKFSIDILWLDASNKILLIENNISPTTYPKVFSPREKALYIVETVAGFAEKNNLKTGDILDVRL